MDINRKIQTTSSVHFQVSLYRPMLSMLYRLFWWFPMWKIRGNNVNEGTKLIFLSLLKQWGRDPGGLQCNLPKNRKNSLENVVSGTRRGGLRGTRAFSSCLFRGFCPCVLQDQRGEKKPAKTTQKTVVIGMTAHVSFFSFLRTSLSFFSFPPFLINNILFSGTASLSVFCLCGRGGCGDPSPSVVRSLESPLSDPWSSAVWCLWMERAGYPLVIPSA